MGLLSGVLAFGLACPSSSSLSLPILGLLLRSRRLFAVGLPAFFAFLVPFPCSYGLAARLRAFVERVLVLRPGLGVPEVSLAP